MRNLPFFALLIIALCFQPTAFAKRKRHPVPPVSNPTPVPVTGSGPILAEDTDKDTHSGKKNENLVGIYNNGEYDPIFELLNRAKESIDIEIYEMSDKQFRAALRRALDRNVAITVVKDPDPLGEECSLFPETDEERKRPADEDCLDQRKLVDEIKEKGGAFVPFNKKELCGQDSDHANPKCFEHGKIIVVDHASQEKSLALLSSGNFNASNLCDESADPKVCNRDYSYVTRDPDVIEALAWIQSHDVKGIRYNLKGYLDGKPELARKLTVSPFTTAAMVGFIRESVKNCKPGDTIQIQNQYMEHPETNAAIKDAAAAGIKVEMMVASACAFGPPRDGDRVKQNYEPLIAAGVKLRFFTDAMKVRGHDGYLHAKAIVACGQKAWMGSVNGSSMSQDQNREYGIFFNNTERVKYLSDVMTGDMNNPDSEDLNESLDCKKDTPKSDGRTPQSRYKHKKKKTHKKRKHRKSAI